MCIIFLLTEQHIVSLLDTRNCGYRPISQANQYIEYELIIIIIIIIIAPLCMRCGLVIPLYHCVFQLECHYSFCGKAEALLPHNCLRRASTTQSI